MSTTIYNGYIITLDDPSLKGLKDFCVEIQKDFKNIKYTLYLKELAKDISNSFDRATLENKPTSHIYWDSINNFKELIDKDFLSFKSEVIFIPIENKLLALYYGNKSIEEIWKMLKEVKEYHYQNQSDMPEDISEEDWEVRRLDWDQALPGAGFPLENGFSFIFTDNKFLPPTISEFSKFYPTFENRINTLSKDILTGEMLLKSKDDPTMYSFSKIDRFLKKDIEGKKLLEEKKKYLRTILKEKIDKII